AADDSVKASSVEGTGGDTSEAANVAGGPTTATSEVQTQPDDFLVLRGIGPVFADRLRAGGVHSFSTLAQMTPDQLSEILGWSPARVRESGIIEQAGQLAQGGD
ncbi:MAG: hypothetical protein ACK2UO_15375, partial [Caldilineaceae bacterium]